MIRWFDSEADDAGRICDKAYHIAEVCDIYIQRRKELTILACDDSGNVVGAVWVSIEGDEYDFDVCVHPEHRNRRHGLDLIEAAIRHFGDVRGAYVDFDMHIRVCVVNPKLVRVLAAKYGFDIQAEKPLVTIMTLHLE